MIAELAPTAGRSHRREIWLAHCMIGDAITTNAAAGRILLALANQDRFGPVRYFLAVCKCGTHQAALPAKSGLIGWAAAAAAAAAGESKEFEGITATAVRLCRSLTRIVCSQ